MSVQTIHLNGQAYVILKRAEYEQLATLAKSAALPALPEPDARGNYPAIEYGRATIARGIIRDRAVLGLSQRELAQRAGIRVETLCRIESGKHTPSLRTIHRIDAALQRASGRKAKTR